MKKIAVLFLLIASAGANADMIITQTVTTGGQTTAMTMKIKGNKIRSDVSPQMSTIMDTATGDTYTIMHAQKSYMKISSDRMKQMADMAKQFQKRDDAAKTEPKPKVVDTGRAEKVNGFNTEIYTMETATSKMTFWVSTDFPNYATVRDQLKKLQTGVLGKLGSLAKNVPDTSEMKGLPVKSEIVTRGQTVTVLITSAEEKPVADSEMAVPADYTEITIPGFGGGAPGQ